MSLKQTRILVADPLPRAALKLLESSGASVRYEPEIPATSLKKALRRTDALILRSRLKIKEETLSSAQLKVIGRAGTGVDNIDVAAATKRGVLVMNTPGANSISAAEHTVAMILALLRNLPQANQSLKSSLWERKKYQGTELYGKTVGLIGLGKIGKLVALRLRSFQAEVLAYDPYVTEEVAKECEVTLVDLKTLLKRADILSLHAPLNQETRGFLNRERLSLCKKNVRIVNCARGELIDEEDLFTALQAKRVGACALDVFAEEPPKNQELLQHPAVIATPHLSASTQEAQERVGIEIASQVVEYLRDGIIRHSVNFPSLSVEEAQKLAPYLRLGYLLGSFLSQASTVRLREVGVRYYGELTTLHCEAITSAAIFGILETFMSETVNLVNARTMAEERGIKIVETKSTRTRGISHVLSLQLRGEKTEWIEGAVFPAEQRSVLFAGHPPLHDLRIISIDGIYIEAPLSPHMLFIRNRDVPGVVGTVGTILGGDGVNIGNFSLGRSAPLKNAVAMINLDAPCPQKTVRKLLQKKPITKASAISLKGF